MACPKTKQEILDAVKKINKELNIQLLLSLIYLKFKDIWLIELFCLKMVKLKKTAILMRLLMSF